MLTPYKGLLSPLLLLLTLRGCMCIEQSWEGFFGLFCFSELVAPPKAFSAETEGSQPAGDWKSRAVCWGMDMGHHPRKVGCVGAAVFSVLSHIRPFLSLCMILLVRQGGVENDLLLT